MEIGKDKFAIKPSFISSLVRYRQSFTAKKTQDKFREDFVLKKIQWFKCESVSTISSAVSSEITDKT